MGKIRVYTCFDTAHDQDLRERLVSESRRADSPFEVCDWSRAGDVATEAGREGLRQRIQRVDGVVVLCGEHTDTADCVSASVDIARQEDKPYFLLWGRSDCSCRKPRAARSLDGMYKWTWEMVKSRIRAGTAAQRAS